MTSKDVNRCEKTIMTRNQAKLVANAKQAQVKKKANQVKHDAEVVLAKEKEEEADRVKQENVAEEDQTIVNIKLEAKHKAEWASPQKTSPQKTDLAPKESR